LWAKICRMSRVLWIVAWVCFVFSIFARILYVLQNHVVTRLLDMIWLQAPSLAKHIHLATENKKPWEQVVLWKWFTWCAFGLDPGHFVPSGTILWVKRCTVSQKMDVPQMGCHHG
jgi:hypothetical protein